MEDLSVRRSFGCYASSEPRVADWRIPLRFTGRTALVLLLLPIWLITNCAHISSFEAVPERVCGTQGTVLRWKATGKLAIRADNEAQASDDPCAASGQSVTKYTLVARRWGKEVSRPAEVAVIQANAREPIVFSSTDVAKGSVIAKGVKDDRWGNDFEIATVAACDGRTIEIQHAGKSVEVKPNEPPSSQLAGAELSGEWELRSPLSPAESNDHSTIPNRLRVVVTVRCKQGIP